MKRLQHRLRSKQKLNPPKLKSNPRRKPNQKTKTAPSQPASNSSGGITEHTVNNPVIPHTDVKPANKINLFVQYYKDKSGLARQEEIDFCLLHNLQNPAIDAVYVIKSPTVQLPTSVASSVTGDAKKLVVISIETRPTFNSVMKFCNQHSGPDDINAVSNSDICFSQSIASMKQLRPTEAIALSRWDLKVPIQTIKHQSSSPSSSLDDTLHVNSKQFKVAYSFDTWMIRGKFPPNTMGVANFHFGIPGCDNRMAAILHNRGKFKMYNPSKNIFTYHVHHTNVRHYNESMRLQGLYVNVMPCIWQ